MKQKELLRRQLNLLDKIMLLCDDAYAKIKEQHDINSTQNNGINSLIKLSGLAQKFIEDIRENDYLEDLDLSDNDNQQAQFTDDDYAILRNYVNTVENANTLHSSN